MTLATRARLAWLPLLLLLAFLAWRGMEIIQAQPPATFGFGIGKAFLAAFFAPGAWFAFDFAWRWRRRARIEGPDTHLPLTWHRRSGSWAVIAIFGGMLLMFGVFALIAALPR
ncbi:hypothetical protein [Caulobacter endophyticus]|uniref:hypothetical protein n=1 Tax=Caulobacter endophyticus TaxID=2172652 RepID=UPI00240EC799|nr:hypothetical protein [Caulobacter endophyticus]MDG2530301.1 hypothetical protein [Caulobacter endophyticus]